MKKLGLAVLMVLCVGLVMPSFAFAKDKKDKNKQVTAVATTTQSVKHDMPVGTGKRTIVTTNDKGERVEREMTQAEMDEQDRKLQDILKLNQQVADQQKLIRQQNNLAQIQAQNLQNIQMVQQINRQNEQLKQTMNAVSLAQSQNLKKPVQPLVVSQPPKVKN